MISCIPIITFEFIAQLVNNIGDVTYLEAQGTQGNDKLHGVHYTHYLPKRDQTGFGWSNPDFKNLNAAGSWTIDGYSASAS